MMSLDIFQYKHTFFYTFGFVFFYWVSSCGAEKSIKQTTGLVQYWIYRTRNQRRLVWLFVFSHKGAGRPLKSLGGGLCFQFSFFWSHSPSSSDEDEVKAEVVYRRRWSTRPLKGTPCPGRTETDAAVGNLRLWSWAFGIPWWWQTETSPSSPAGRIPRRAQTRGRWLRKAPGRTRSGRSADTGKLKLLILKKNGVQSVWLQHFGFVVQKVCFSCTL